MLEVMRFSDGRPHWDFLFHCLAQDWEVDSLALSLDMLFSTNVRGVSANKLC